MERTMNDENNWDHNMETDALEGPVVCVSRVEVVQALNEMEKKSLDLQMNHWS